MGLNCSRAVRFSGLHWDTWIALFFQCRLARNLWVLHALNATAIVPSRRCTSFLDRTPNSRTRTASRWIRRTLWRRESTGSLSRVESASIFYLRRCFRTKLWLAVKASNRVCFRLHRSHSAGKCGGCTCFIVNTSNRVRSWTKKCSFDRRTRGSLV